MDLEQIVNYSKPKETFYTILGCDVSSSADQITREYRIRALEVHPDKNKNPGASETFKRLQKAKETLLDPTTRKQYDLWLTSGLHIPFDEFNNRKVRHSMHWACPRNDKLSINDGQEPNGQGSDITTNEHEKQQPHNNGAVTSVTNMRPSPHMKSATFINTELGQNDNGSHKLNCFPNNDSTSNSHWLGKFRRYEV